MSVKRPLISIIIVNYNGKKWLQNCFTSLLKQTYKNFEIIFVDNASTDGSIMYVKNHFPKVKVVETHSNLGFAGGNNEGYKHAKGEYILLLNNDTYVKENYLQEFIKAFQEIPNLGIAQSKLILTNERGLDTCGGYWTDTAFLYYVGNFKDPQANTYSKPFPVFTCKGASVLIKREVIENIGLFDQDFWSYYEETDLCHRAWIAGYESWYYPAANCYHEMGGTSLTFKNDFIQFHNFKNKLASFLKNLSTRELIKVIPIFLFLNSGIAGVWIFQGKWKNSFALIRAVYWNFKNLSSTFQKRMFIQKRRKLSDDMVWRKVKKNPQLIYYKYLFNDDLGKYSDTL